MNDPAGARDDPRAHPFGPAAGLRRCAGWLIALLLFGFIVAAIATGWLRQSVLHVPVLVALDIKESGLPISHARGHGYAVDLSLLAVAARGDRIGQDAGPVTLTVLHAVVMENGVPLLPGLWPGQVIDEPGRFLLQGRVLYLSASDGSDPRDNGRRYALALQVPRWSLRAGDPFHAYQAFFHASNALLPAAVTAGAACAFGAALAAALAQIGASSRARLLVATIAFAAAFGGLAVEAGPHWNDVIVGYDTESYMEPAENSFRPPGFALFSRAVNAGPGPAVFHDYPKERRVIGDQGDGVLRLVRAEKLMAAISLLVLGLALCFVVPATVAAAIVLGLGNVASAVPVLFGSPIYGSIVTIVGALALVASLACGLMRRGAGHWRAAMLASGAIVAASASGMVLQYGVFADFMDWAMSETVAHALGLLTLAAAMAFLFAGWRWMLPVAALGAALVCLTRQAEPYYWVVVLGLLPVAFRRSRGEGWRQTAVVVVLFLLSTVGLHTAIAASSRTVQLGELHRMAFALLVADPADVDLMPDATTRAFFADAMAQSDRVIGPWTNRPPGVALHFYGLSFDIAWPTALKVAQADGAADREREARALLGRAAKVVLAQRYDRYLRFAAASLAEVAAMMRAGYLVPWWLLAAAMLVAMATVRGLHAYLAVLLVAAALAGYALIAFASGPIPRLVYPIDLLWFLAGVVLAVGAWQRWRASAAPSDG